MGGCKALRCLIIWGDAVKYNKPRAGLARPVSGAARLRASVYPSAEEA